METYLLIIVAILFSAFFSGMEIAFLSSSRLRIELDRKQGVFGSGIIRYFTLNPGQYIATMLIGNNITLVIYGLLMSNLLSPVIHPLVKSDALTLVIQTIISTALILFTGEFIPKAAFLINPNFFLKLLSMPAFFFFMLFYPVARITLAASNLFIRLVTGVKTAERRQENIVFSKVDLDHFVDQTRKSSKQGDPDHHNIKIFQKAMGFSNIRIRESMVPRTEIEAVEISSGIEALRQKFIDTRHSRILVYQDTIDHITGYFEIKDLLKNPPDIRSGLRRLSIVPETMPASKLLSLFVEEKKSVAVVVDEFGGTSGMITIEDVLEEIVGDIEDEHDTNELIERKASPNEYILSGRLELDYLNEKYHFSLPEEDDYETLAGMVLYYHGSIPKVDDVVRIRNLVIRVLRATSTRIDLVSLKVE